MAESVFQPILARLSPRDIDVLIAMSDDAGKTRTADLLERLGIDDSYLQRYRARLIEAGVVEAPRRGALDFAVPLLREHLRETATRTRPERATGAAVGAVRPDGN